MFNCLVLSSNNKRILVKVYMMYPVLIQIIVRVYLLYLAMIELFVMVYQLYRAMIQIFRECLPAVSSYDTDLPT